MSTFRLRTAVAALAVSSAIAATAAPAAAADPPTGMRTVCVKSTYLYVEAGRGWQGTMFRGDKIRVRRYSPSGRWAYGRAYGDINRNGWVKARALRCT